MVKLKALQNPFQTLTDGIQLAVFVTKPARSDKIKSRNGTKSNNMTLVPVVRNLQQDKVLSCRRLVQGVIDL